MFQVFLVLIFITVRGQTDHLEETDKIVQTDVLGEKVDHSIDNCNYGFTESKVFIVCHRTCVIISSIFMAGNPRRE